jgi:hypothetical protein
MARTKLRCAPDVMLRAMLAELLPATSVGSVTHSRSPHRLPGVVALVSSDSAVALPATEPVWERGERRGRGTAAPVRRLQPLADVF